MSSGLVLTATQNGHAGVYMLAAKIDGQPVVVQEGRLADQGDRGKFLRAIMEKLPDQDCMAIEEEILGLAARAATKAGESQPDTGYPLTDTGLAERFAAQHGDSVRFCHPWGKWLVWDGRRWAIDQTAAVERLAKDTARSIYQEAAGEPDSDQRKAIVGFARGSESSKRRAAILRLAQSEPIIPVLPEALDCDAMLLNVLNGTIDLRTGELRAHDRGDFLTKLAPVEYNPDADCAVWLAVLDRIFNGGAELIAFVQRLLGHCLSGDVSEQVLPIFYGEGSNGKTTLLNAVMAVMGPDYAMKAPTEMLVAKRHDSHPTERCDLFGKRLVAAAETEDGGRLAEPLVKELTGGERIRARRMREDTWEFSPTAKIILSTNHRPEVRGQDHAIWRRLKLVPFSVTIPDDQQDKHLPAKLAAEASGILAWLVAGCLDWQRHGLTPPDEVQTATKGYRQQEDVTGAFLAECCELAPGATCRASTLYATYKAWAEAAGEYVVNQRRFGQAMTERGFERYENHGMWYRGIDVGTE